MRVVWHTGQRHGLTTYSCSPRESGTSLFRREPTAGLRPWCACRAGAYVLFVERVLAAAPRTASTHAAAWHSSLVCTGYRASSSSRRVSLVDVWLTPSVCRVTCARASHVALRSVLFWQHSLRSGYAVGVLLRGCGRLGLSAVSLGRVVDVTFRQGLCVCCKRDARDDAI